MRTARASPPTPPPQPSPKIGRRSTSREKGSRLRRRASRLGIARPVMVLTTMAPMSASSMPAAATALSVASSRSASAWRWKEAVRSSQPRPLQVPIGRLANVSALDAGVGKHARQAGQMREEARRRLGDGLLQDLVLWHGGRHRCDLDVESRHGFGVRPARNSFLQGSVLPWKPASFLPIDGQSRSLLGLGLSEGCGGAARTSPAECACQPIGAENWADARYGAIRRSYQRPQPRQPA